MHLQVHLEVRLAVWGSRGALGVAMRGQGSLQPLQDGGDKLLHCEQAVGGGAAHHLVDRLKCLQLQLWLPCLPCLVRLSAHAYADRLHGMSCTGL